MTSRELYEQHLAKMAPGTALHAQSGRVLYGTASVDDLLAVATWELWECIYSLPPEAGAKGEHNNSGECARITDAWHASACAARVTAMLEQIKTLLAKAPA